MQISINELEEKGYRLLHKMSHAELMPFLMPYLSRFNLATFSFFLFIFCCFGGIVFLLVKSIVLHLSALAAVYLVAGFFVAYALIPLHEYIHALAYRANGAKEVNFDLNFRKFIFLTIADKFVANRKEFFVIVLAPFVVINAALLTAFLFAGLNGQMLLIGMLLVHTLCCIGDFGLLSYYLSNKKSKILTYDDKELKETYFYEAV